MIPTLWGISVVCFLLIQFVPGGPVEEMIARVQGANAIRGASTTAKISPEEIQNIKAYYGFDKPMHVRYVSWLKNLLKLDMGVSYSYRKPVWDVISSKFPVSLFFGLTSFLLSYAVCIPLGIIKAVRNGSHFDTWSSVTIFVGYVVPGYALGILLITFLAGGQYLDLFPLSGLTGDEWDEYTLLGKILDVIYHGTLPMVCYMASEFAFLTLLTKNSLLEELHKDYLRTAQVKGATYMQAVWKHGLRNALIPVATRLSEIFTILFASALLIERVFDIDGMGLLFYNSIVGRDYNVVMGIIVLSSALAMFGRLFSDILMVIVDPRIHFD